MSFHRLFHSVCTASLGGRAAWREYGSSLYRMYVCTFWNLPGMPEHAFYEWTKSVNKYMFYKLLSLLSLPSTLHPRACCICIYSQQRTSFWDERPTPMVCPEVSSELSAHDKLGSLYGTIMAYGIWNRDLALRPRIRVPPY